ncbi:MAG: plasmid replication/partition related protein [Stenotrophomonas sp.]
MDIIVKEELKAYIDPLTAEEHEALERSLLAEGCRDALVLWGNILVDGHNRYGICTQHGIEFRTVQHPHLKSMDDVHLWMIEQHLGRRSVSDFQRGVLALRKKAIVDARRNAEQERLARESAGEPVADDQDTPPWEPAPKLSKADLARQARLSTAQVTQIEKIHAHAAPEVIEAVKNGEINLSTAATLVSLSEDEQRQAAAGGKAELKQAAKRVREAKRKPRADKHGQGSEAPLAGEDADHVASPAELQGEVSMLRRQVMSLTAENQALRMELDALRARLPVAEPADSDY